MTEIKKGVLAVSYGVCGREIREKTIDRMEADMRARYPDRLLYRAFTGDAVRTQIGQNEGLPFDDPAAAFKRMAADGINEVLVQPVFVTGGAENEKLIQTARGSRPLFASVFLGRPLMAMSGDRLQIVQIMTQTFALQRDEGLILMGHGSEHAGSSAYASLDRQFKDMGYPNVYVATQEGAPSYGTVMRKLKKTSLRKVTVTPLFMAADAGVADDLAGDQDESWKSRLETDGFSVTCSVRGLLEYPRVRNLLLDHMEQAEEV